jgi:cell wall-associated NlpC family hydrolase
MVRVEGSDLLVRGPGGEQRHAFATVREAEGRAAFIAEALSWVGTPFRDCADIKGPNGAVDCAMLLVRSAVDTGRIPPFDPRPYSPRWMLHRTEEKFLGWMVALGAREVETPRIGDIVLWQFGRTFAHGAVLINATQIVHAYAHARCVLVSDLDEPLLRYLPVSFGRIPRPVRYFDLWS